MPCPNCHCPSCLALAGSPIPSTEFPPPPSELVTTNRAPTSLEVADSRNIINSAGKAIQSIQAMIDDLEERKSELSGLISTHKAAISPLKSFPPELLVEIFAQFISMIPYSDDSISPPLMFMGICSQWRQIVLDTPRLWTKILTAHPMIDYWVDRSGALPLHVDLNFIYPGSYLAQEALIPHSRRWERVNLSISSDSNSDLARVRTRLDSLKYLSLYPGDTTGTIDFCEVAPQLTEIKLMEFFEPVVIKLPWEQLEVCTLDNAEIIHYALRHAKNLRVLHVGIYYSAPELFMSIPRDSHSVHLGLSTLDVRWDRPFPEMGINPFPSITLPSLRTLKISFHSFNLHKDLDSIHRAKVETDRAEAASILAGFFERSCAHLSTLTLTDIPFSQSELVKCLAVAPSLVSLDIQFDGEYHEIRTINNELLLRLSVSHPGHVLPRLRSLALRGPGMYYEEFLDYLIKSRREIDPENDGVALLENLTLQRPVGPWSPPDTHPPRFQRFVSEGLKITYEDYRYT